MVLATAGDKAETPFTGRTKLLVYVKRSRLRKFRVSLEIWGRFVAVFDGVEKMVNVNVLMAVMESYSSQLLLASIMNEYIVR